MAAHFNVASARAWGMSIDTVRRTATADDAPQAILDRLIDSLGVDADESRREIDDQRFEAETLRDLDLPYGWS